MKTNPFVFILCLLCMVSFSCKKEKDPCAGIKTADASFAFQATVDGPIPAKNYIWYDVTRMYTAGLVQFNLTDKSCDSVWWTIGLDPRIFREKTFSLRFGQYGSFEVQCVVYNSKSAACTDDDGYDTVVRVLEMLPNVESPSKGKFQGYFTNDPDKKLREFRIDTGDLYPNFLYMVGFPDTSCDFASFYGRDTRFLVWDPMIHDHQISFISAIGGLHNTNKCDCVNATGFASPEFIDQIPTIYWSDNYTKLNIKLWQKIAPSDTSGFHEVWFIGERIQ